MMGFASRPPAGGTTTANNFTYMYINFSHQTQIIPSEIHCISTRTNTIASWKFLQGENFHQSCQLLLLANQNPYPPTFSDL